MTNIRKKYKRVIIGVGAVAAGYDYPGSREVTTHAHALSIHPRTTLAGLFDLDLEKAERAAKTWQTRSFASLSEMFREVRPDIVSVCTPNGTHAAILREIIKYRPKLVIAEKPLTT